MKELTGERGELLVGMSCVAMPRIHGITASSVLCDQAIDFMAPLGHLKQMKRNQAGMIAGDDGQSWTW
jgi:hypothetical protein